LNPITDFFEKIKKIKSERAEDGIQAIAGGKVQSELPEVAVGYTSGQIMIHELDAKNKRKTCFPPGKINEIVVEFKLKTKKIFRCKQSLRDFAGLQQ
jgi:hypothetical protein